MAMAAPYPAPGEGSRTTARGGRATGAYRGAVVNLRVLVAMTVGAVVAACGALFLGEYEFDTLLPVVAGPILGLVVAEIVVSLGGHRSATMAAIVATWVATAMVLAGHLAANGVEPIAAGAYLSAAVGAVAASARIYPWRGRSSTASHVASSTTTSRR